MAGLDCIVLGTGGVGSAALHHLARRGARALGIERFAPGHDRGSSHGETRIIRLAYFEHPDYVPLLRRAYALWEELEARCGLRLYHETGLLEVGPRAGVVVPGVLASARRHALEVEALEPREAERRFPGFRIPDGMAVVFERRAGYLRVEDCVRAHAGEAVRLGARLATGETVLRWRVDGAGVEVETDRATHRAARLVVAAGAWAGGLLAELGVRLEVRRKTLLWYRTLSPRHREAEGGPGFFYETPGGLFYGFPELRGGELKVAEHSGGEAVADPLAVDRSLRDADRAPVEAFLRRCVPGVASDGCLRHAVCLYTMSPDEHFVVDRVPAHPQVSFAAGLSGHGFKFTSVLGEVLADLALDGGTELPIGFLSCERPGLRSAPPGERLR
jgi:monomeric sarcosine oxidase